MKNTVSIFASAIALATPALTAGTCQTGYTICSPSGATSSNTPSITSPQFPSLLQDLLASPLPPLNKRADGTASLCCVSSLSCLTLANLAVPFCYDKFTTNFVLPDNSFGTIATGAYSSSNGDKANLLTGEYTLANGQQGNFYTSNSAAQPNTATLRLPAQFTGVGVGSAIPASELGAFRTLTFTTTLPGSTIPGTTISPTTVSGSTLSSLVTASSLTSLSLQTLGPSTVQGTTRSESLAPATTVLVTTTEALPAGSAAATTSKNSGAGRGVVSNVAGGLVVVMSLFVWFG
ncbi:hypothetical protein HYFRA_00002607 [Hymenoscyphus fraxineus]|uniref:Uncharacterized protein n=1 Tax=Hymenoscyphus fraxineus TaxID=746836 RepID=A0A9N9LB92_9HELO|nr:hypothetical protein HYFRA_00002607 [Hymenoscyphus fraxineus]